MHEGPIALGPVAIALAASLIVLNGGLSIWLRLGLEKKLAIATFRSIVQLTLLGLILIPIFQSKNPLWTLLFCSVMIFFAARVATGRVSRTYKSMTPRVLTALFLSGLSTALFGAIIVVGVKPFWTPQYFIPFLGMILGNAMTGITLGLDRALAQLTEGRPLIEARLSFGLSTKDAYRPVAAEALRTAMLPMLNTMTAVGIVQIPGMMTGQILGGTPPELAARYQIVILFLIVAATAIGAGLAVWLTLRAAIDDQGRLRWGLIEKRVE